jgi:hypothetical protein
MKLAGADATKNFSTSTVVIDDKKVLSLPKTVIDGEKGFVTSAPANIILTLSDFCFVVIKNKQECLSSAASSSLYTRKRKKKFVDNATNVQF